MQADKKELIKKYKLSPDDINDNEVGTFLELDPTKSGLNGLFTFAELRRIADAMEEWSKENEKSFYRLFGEKI